MTNNLNIIDNSPFFYFLSLDRAGQAILHVINRSSAVIKGCSSFRLFLSTLHAILSSIVSRYDKSDARATFRGKK